MALIFPGLQGQGGVAQAPSLSPQESDAASRLTAKYGTLEPSKPSVNTAVTPPPTPVPEKGLLKSLVSAPATMLARPFQAAQSLGDYIGTRMEANGTPEQVNAVLNAEADRQKQKETDTGSVIAPTPKGSGSSFYGVDVSSPDVKKDIGRGLQTVALGMPVMTGGAAFGTGMAMEQGHDFASAQTAIDAVMGTAGGKVLGLVGKPLFNVAGKVIGKVTPEFIQNLAGKGAKAIEDFAAQHEILPESLQGASNAVGSGVQKVEDNLNKPFDLAGEFLKNKASSVADSVTGKITATKADNVPGAIDDLEQNLNDIAQGYKSTRKAQIKSDEATKLKNAAGTEGKSEIRMAAELGIIPEYEGTRFVTHAQADTIRSQVAPLNNALNEGLKEVEVSAPTPKTIDIANRFKELVDKNVKTDAQRRSMINDGIQELSNLGREVPITKLNVEKSGHWDLTKFTSGEKEVTRQYHYLMAKAMQEEIQSTAEKAGLTHVAQLNRDIGDRLGAANFIDSLDSKTVLNGKMGKHFLRLAGTITGAKSGPLQAAFGFMGGDIVSRMLTSYSIASPINRYLLKDLEARDPVSYAKVMEWVKQQGVDREGRVNSGMLLGTGATHLGAETKQSIPPNVEGNKMTQDAQILNNTKALPAPTETIITPNNQGTPNQLGVPYSPSDVAPVGGLQQRITNQK